MKIALAGNPNSGKTPMYNALTSRSETIGQALPSNEMRVPSVHMSTKNARMSSFNIVGTANFIKNRPSIVKFIGRRIRI